MFLWARKIHRLLVLVISVLGLFMMGTGMTMKFPGLFIGVDFGLVRRLHNNLSIWFAASLAVMMITGLYMYLYPVVMKWKNRKES